jgi:hypothetical protein
MSADCVFIGVLIGGLVVIVKADGTSKVLVAAGMVFNFSVAPETGVLSTLVVSVLQVDRTRVAKPASKISLLYIGSSSSC